MSVANNKHEYNPKFANNIVNFTMNNFEENKNKIKTLQIQ